MLVTAMKIGQDKTDNICDTSETFKGLCTDKMGFDIHKHHQIQKRTFPVQINLQRALNTTIDNHKLEPRKCKDAQ